MAFPVDEERIEAAERALGRALPPALRERLRRDDGGDVDLVPELPEGAVVVAADGRGDRLLLLEGQDEPRRLDHETGELEPVATDWT